ncbi:MAG: Mut7-C RNAse domain-containing protein, partial [Desulfurococcaceae archaeon]
MSDEPRFIVDNMLGSLARWLRILGYDTAYDRDAEDWQIIRRAELERRIVVTKDRALHNKALKHGIRSILLWEESIEDFLAHLAFVTGIRLGVNFEKTRCP